MRRTLPRRAALLLLATALSAPAFADDRTGAAAPGPSVAAIEAFIGVPLPADRHDLHAADEAGIDRLMRLRFDAPEAQATAFAARLVPAGLEPGRDPGLAALGADLDWWLDPVPPDALGGEATTADNRVFKLVTLPAGPGLRRVWLAAFTL